MPKGGRVRVGPSNVQLDDEWLRRFAIQANGGAELGVYPGNYEQSLDTSTINRYLEAVKKKRGNVYEGLSVKEILIKLRAITPEGATTLFGKH